MSSLNLIEIGAIVFDLDGTLYVSDEFAASIKYDAAVYMADLLAVSIDEARLLINETHIQLAEQSSTIPTLSSVCCSLGGNVPALHAHFEKNLQPESYLLRDNRVTELLKCLQKHYALFIYTNNNRILTTRILDYLGLDGLFRQIFTIEDTWKPKPDEERLKQIISFSGLQPSRVLFVGDRYDVDLRLPEQLGCPVFLSQNNEQLLRLSQLVPC